MRGIQPFEEIGELLRTRHPGIIDVGKLLFNGLLLGKKCRLALFEKFTVKESINQRVREPSTPCGDLAELQIERLAMLRSLVLPVCLHALDLLAQIGTLFSVQLAGEEERADLPIGGLLFQVRRGAVRGVTAVVDEALLRFADQGVAAALAAHGAAQEEVMPRRPRRELAVEDRLHPIEE